MQWSPSTTEFKLGKIKIAHHDALALRLAFTKAR
jgi:hypothetical protein